MPDTIFSVNSIKNTCKILALYFGFFLLVTTIYLFWYGINQTIIIPANHFISEEGFSYWIDLTHLDHSELHSQADTLDEPTKSRLIILESGKEIGSRHSIHADIRRIGEGYFSHWSNGVYLSTSDNTDPRTNNRVYAIEYRTYPEEVYAYTTVILVLIILAWNHNLVLKVLRRLLANDARFVTIITAVSLLIMLALLESGFRYFTPFELKQWPIQFYPSVGFHFKPNAEIKHTNYLDFWVTDKSNSWGFLDKETPLTSTKTCHVSLIGDSFVEAAQVELPYKVQRLLENWAYVRHPDWKLTTSAFGYSGTGQLNQLPFYTKYARHLKPNLVILVFVSNDFANNSSVLEALRNGWHPDSTPRVFSKIAKDGTFKLTDIDPDWQNKRLKEVTNTSKDNTIHKRLINSSYLYRWVWLKLSLLAPSLEALAGPTQADRILNRAHQLFQDPSVAPRLTGWKVSFANDIDRPLHELYLPKIYRDTINATRFALQEFKKLTDSDGARLILLAASQFKTSAGGKDKMYYASQRLKMIADELEIPLIDQYNFIQQQGGNPLAAQFKHDAHWTKQGHRWAAEAILNYLEKNISTCQQNQT
ncbi:MAG: hypothetical protein V3U84_05400 [Thiotrichaceae bacterium]